MSFKENMAHIAVHGINISKIKRERHLLKEDLLKYLKDNLDKGMVPFFKGDEVSYSYKRKQGDVSALFEGNHVSFIKVYGDILDYDRSSTFIINVALFLGEQLIKDIEWN